MKFKTSFKIKEKTETGICAHSHKPKEGLIVEHQATE
jgi:hypothetical protein